MLLLPSVSIGNVPQLALDLLIHTYDFKLVRSLRDDYMYPVVGPRDFTTKPEPGISTPAELYSLNDIKIVQLRSPHLPNCRQKFLDQLAADLDEKPDLIIGSASAGMRSEELGEARLVQYNTKLSPLFEAGIFEPAIAKFGADGIVLYTYEGDNTENAEQVASDLVKRLELEPKSFVYPESWKRLYGKRIPDSFEEGLYA